MEQFLNMAPVASLLFVLNLVLSLLAFYNDRLHYNLMLHPYSISRGKRVYTIITSGFIHGDWMHLFFNMWSFFAFAFTLEGIIGHWQFALLYFASLILSDLPSIGKHKDDYNYHSLGASGAISAVIFSYILFNPLTDFRIFPFPFPIKAIIFGVLYLVYCAYASKRSQDNINHDAHFFGALAGVMITIFLYHDAVSIFLRQLGL